MPQTNEQGIMRIVRCVSLRHSEQSLKVLVA